MGDTPAVFRATYSDLRIVKARKLFQVVLEAPLEQMETFVRLFGAPNPSAEKWCAIARLRDETRPTASERGKASYAGGTEGEQAVTRCVLLTKDEEFWNWLMGYCQNRGLADGRITSEAECSMILKGVLDVESRADLALGGEPLARFHALEGEYRAQTGRAAEVR